ncbi:hypothetical protein LD001_01415 [Pseudomonas kurunegalensis]|uniref:hypothetical protein n=1 Tax=Pseudomonas kurunegalensis TaxID=485880 RepID=UPI001CDC73EB|nr:hypothetical protein [Pseudomonas kurunegalensis]MCA4073988.1 hypothetical protein [Pseudomonas kurunegalensis]
MQRNEKDAATRSTVVEGRATSLSGFKWGNRRWLPVMFVQQEMGQVLACLYIFSACEIERRPRGASRAALAPTFVSGQLCLWDLRANALGASLDMVS